MKRKGPQFLIQSRTIYDRSPKTHKRFSGGRVRYGDWKNWDKYLDNKINFRLAVQSAKKKLRQYQVGTIVYIRRLTDRGRPTKDFIKLFQAKWGHDDKPFMRFDGQPGFYWGIQSGLIKRPKPRFG